MTLSYDQSMMMVVSGWENVVSALLRLDIRHQSSDCQLLRDQDHLRLNINMTETCKRRFQKKIIKEFSTKS